MPNQSDACITALPILKRLAITTVVSINKTALAIKLIHLNELANKKAAAPAMTPNIEIASTTELESQPTAWPTCRN